MLYDDPQFKDRITLQIRKLGAAADYCQLYAGFKTANSGKRFQQQIKTFLTSQHTDGTDHFRSVYSPGVPRLRGWMKGLRIHTVVRQKDILGQKASVQQILLYRLGVDNHFVGELVGHSQ